MHRWSETETEKHTETVRDKQRHRQTEMLLLNALFITCLTRTGLPRVYELQLPKEELGVLETCGWTEPLPRERSDRGRMPGSVESLSTWKAVSRFRTYKRASELRGTEGHNRQ